MGSGYREDGGKIMEHDFSINGSYTTAALQILFCVSLMVQSVLRRYNLMGRFMRFALTYFYSFSPVAMLIYSLYVVHNLR